MRILPPLLTVLLLFVTTIIIVCSSSVVDAFKVLFFSDLHLDPLWGTAKAGRGGCNTAPTSDHIFGKYGCDSPMSLVNESVRQAAAEDPDLVLVSGDWIRHSNHGAGDELNYTEMQSIVSNITNLLYSHLGHNRKTVLTAKPPLTDALGNNDAQPDYDFNISAPTKMMLTDIAEQLKLNYFLDADEAAKFGQCGYYKRTINVGKQNKALDIITLNTLLWDIELTPANQLDLADPCGQFAFLESSIASTTNPIVVVAHIPPGIDLHESQTEVVNNQPITYYYKDSFAARFRFIIKANKDRFKLLVFAHTHHVAFIADKDLGVPSLVVGAVSPIYFNAPNYLTMEFDDNTMSPKWNTLTQTAISNFSANAVWRKTTPDFAHTFCDVNVGASSVATMLDEFHQYFDQMCNSSDKTFGFYNYSAAYGKPLTTCGPQCRLITSCYLRHLTRNETINCYNAGCNPPANLTFSYNCLTANNNTNNNGEQYPETWRIVGGVIGGILLLAILIVYFKSKAGVRRSGNSSQIHSAVLEENEHLAGNNKQGYPSV